jgi:hypothetical protein
MGRYDSVIIAEAPDDAARLLRANGAQGNVRTKTLKAFTEDGYREILATLPTPLPYYVGKCPTGRPRTPPGDGTKQLIHPAFVWRC